MALDLDELNVASYQKMSSGEENNNSDQDFLIDEPSMSADNGLSRCQDWCTEKFPGLSSRSHVAIN